MIEPHPKPGVCHNRRDEILYVNRVGMYKFGTEGTSKVGGFRTVVQINETPGTPYFTPVAMRLNRIMASTFVPVPRRLPGVPACVYVDRLDPDYVPGLVHANTLSWTRPGQNVERMFDTTDVRVKGEVWRFSERYQLHVSNRGRFKTDMGTINSFSAAKCVYGMGYHRFHVRGESVHFHAVVADAFFGPPPPDKPMIDHIDGDSYNNTPLNLRYVDCTENNNNRRFDQRPVPTSLVHADYDWVQAKCYPYNVLEEVECDNRF